MSSHSHQSAMKQKEGLVHFFYFKSLPTSWKCFFNQPSLGLILSFNKHTFLSVSKTLLSSLCSSLVMGDYTERPAERETNRVVCKRRDREGPSNGRPFKAKKEKLIMIKGL